MKLFLICLGTTLCIFGSSWRLCGQTRAGLAATVQFSDGHSISVTDFSHSIGIQPRELVNVTIQFPSDAIGAPIIVEALDGGSTSIGSSIPVVGNDGSIHFTFVAPGKSGAKAIGIRAGSRILSLQFSVTASAL